MKKLLPLFLAVVIALALSGCKRKSTESVETDLTSPPANTFSQTEGSPTPTATTIAADSSLASAVDVASIDAIFKQNFTLAEQDAKSVMGDETKFCFARVSFLGGIVSPTGQMDYFFENSAKIKDYWWLVSFDTAQDNQKKRYLAAKRDWAGIVCTTAKEPPSFASVYTNLAATGKITPSTALSSARIAATLNNNSWQFDFFSIDGKLFLSEKTVEPPISATPISPSN